MPRTKKPSTGPGDKSLPSLENFIASVKFVMMNDHGAPEFVADALLSMDDDYVRKQFSEKCDLNSEGGCDLHDLMFDIAAELASKPAATTDWVRVRESQIVVEVSHNIQTLLEKAVKVGLYGESIDDVVRTMIARGIESTFHIISEPTR